MTARNWPRLAGLALIIAALLAGLAPVPVAAEPPKPEACAGVPIDPTHGEFIWCVPWADNDKDSSVTCTRATAVSDAAMCAAVLLELYGDPKKKGGSVLGKKDGKVHCEAWDHLMGPGGDVPVITQRRSSCLSFKEFLESRTWQTASTLPEECDLADVACAVGKVLSAGIRDGVQGVVDLMVQANVYLLGLWVEVVFSTTSFHPSDAFYWSYNRIAGVAIALAFVFFLVSLIFGALKPGGPGPVAALLGVVRAIVGIFLAGGIAWVVTAAWDEVTIQLIKKSGTSQWTGSAWVTALSELTTGGGTLALAGVISFFSIIGLVLCFIVLFFRGILVQFAALFGAIAMSGQAYPGARHWASRWFWTVNALGMSRFLMEEIWQAGGRMAYGSNNLVTALSGLVTIWMMVACPAVLMRMAAIWDGYLADINGGAVLSGIAQAAGVGDMVGQGLDAIGKSSGDSAPSQMDSNASRIPTTPGASESPGQALGAISDGSDTAAKGVDASEAGEKVGKPATGDIGQGNESGDAGDSGESKSQGQKPTGDEAETQGAASKAAGDDLANGRPPTPQDSAGGGEQPGAPTTPGTDSKPADGGAPSLPGAGGNDQPGSGPDPSPGPQGGSGKGGENPGGGASAAGEVPPVIV